MESVNNKKEIALVKDFSVSYYMLKAYVSEEILNWHCLSLKAYVSQEILNWHSHRHSHSAEL